MNIRIHNDIWKVKLTDGSKKKMTPDAEHYNLGLCEYDKQVINIRSGLSKSVARSTIIHELVHAFQFSYGNQVEGEEQMKLNYLLMKMPHPRKSILPGWVKGILMVTMTLKI